MTLDDVLNRLVDDGKVAVERDYAGPARQQKREGALAGFEDCRGKTVDELRSLLENAGKRTRCARDEEAENYWWTRCYEAEIGWVCNCVSVILLDHGLPVIVQPTARAMLKVLEIVGIASVATVSLP